MGSTAEICGPSSTADTTELSVHDQIRQVLANAAEVTESGAAAGAVLKQFEGNDMSWQSDVQPAEGPR